MYVKACVYVYVLNRPVWSGLECYITAVVVVEKCANERESMGSNSNYFPTKRPPKKSPSNFHKHGMIIV